MLGPHESDHVVGRSLLLFAPLRGRTKTKMKKKQNEGEWKKGRLGQHTAVVWCGLESTTRSCIWQKYEKNTNFGYRTKKSEKKKKKKWKKNKKNNLQTNHQHTCWYDYNICFCLFKKYKAYYYG